MFNVIESDPIKAEDYRLRANLLLEIRDVVEEKGIQFSTLKDSLSVTEAEVSDLLNGKFRKFSKEELIQYLDKLKKEK